MSEPAAYPGWTRPAEPYDAAAWLLPMPVLSPYRGGQAPQLRHRKHPGHPDCPDCTASGQGFCDDHAGYFHAYNPAWSVGLC